MQIFIRKLNESVELDWENLPENSKRYIIEYGATQTSNDVHANTNDPAKVRELVAKRLAQLTAGTPPAIGQKSDPVTAEARLIIVGMLRDLGMKAADAKEKAADLETGLIAILTKRGVDAKKMNNAVEVNMKAIMVKAKANAAQRNTDVELVL